MNRTITFPGPADRAVEAVKLALEQQGYKIQRSFDLQSAIRHPVPGCTCPHHGAHDCTCQYVVLLAYPLANHGAGTPPHVFTAHSRGEMTWVTLQHDEMVDEDEDFALVSALVEAAMLLAAGRPVAAHEDGVSMVPCS